MASVHGAGWMGGGVVHPPHILCLIYMFTSLSNYLSRNNPNPPGCTQSVIKFLTTNTIARLLTPPPPAPTATAPTATESSGEAHPCTVRLARCPNAWVDPTRPVGRRTT